jgi:anti-anti-sigma regulatory factor
VAVPALLERVALGDHVCWTADDNPVRLDVIAAFLRAGLTHRHKVVYCGPDAGAVLTAMRATGVDTTGLLYSGQLRATTAEASYLSAGHFDAETTVKQWQAESAQSRAEGYAGIRVVGDMNWAHRSISGGEQLEGYERRINTVFTEGYVAGVCLYDRRLFDPLDLRRISAAHPGAVASGWPFDPAIALRIRAVREPYGLRLTGEADRSNRDALATVIERLFDSLDGDRLVTVDVAGLRFADAAVARLFVHAAAGGPGRLHLTGCAPVLRRLLDFHGADRVPGLTVDLAT